MTWRMQCGDCREVMREMDACSVDSVATDPPYGLSFMARDWDRAVPGPEYWAEALRVAKPGAHLAAFGGTRTFHRLACAIEDAGWELRDTLSWMYGQGFPKSHNPVEGKGTALKPAWEPIILARKPPRGTVEENFRAYGTGMLEIDACRIGHNEPAKTATRNAPRYSGVAMNGGKIGGVQSSAASADPSGRWPANVVLDEEAAAMLGAVSRFFYCAKASRSEREAGLEAFEAMIVNDGRETSIDNPYQRGDTKRKNTHPTVKPVELMRWIVRLITPPGGVVLDPFAGSGTTGIAAVLEGWSFYGIDINPLFSRIADARISHRSRLGK